MNYTGTASYTDRASSNEVGGNYVEAGMVKAFVTSDG